MNITAPEQDGTDDALLVLQAASNRGVATTEAGQLMAFHFRRRTGRPLPGDRITLDPAGALERILPRRNRFGRGDSRGKFKPIAANLEQVLIVIAPQPAPSRDLLHRYLVAARVQDIVPIIVVNKTDLALPDAAPFNELQGLADLGYRIVWTRCTVPPRVDRLERLLTGHTSLLAGQSGVGKSSLLNALIPDLDLQTGMLSRVTGKGTHTTTSATLHRLPASGWLVDTPGVWEYGLWRMDARTLERGFPEFSPHTAACRFRDCRHHGEPGCAVSAAVERAELPAFRYQAWLRLLAEQQRLAAGQA